MKRYERYGMWVEPISYGKCKVGSCNLEYNRCIRYDKTDGKYKSGWIVVSPNGVFVAVNKDHAIKIAVKNQYLKLS